MYQSTQLWTPGNEQVDGARGNTRAALRRKSWHVVAWYHGDRNDGPCTASLPHSGQCHPLCCHPKRSEPDLCLQLSYHVYARSRRLAARPQPTIPPSCPRRPPWNWCSHTKQTTAMLLDQRSRPLCALCSCGLRVVVKSSVFFLIPLIKQLAALAAFEKRPSHGPACAKVYFLDIICCCQQCSGFRRPCIPTPKRRNNASGACCRKGSATEHCCPIAVVQLLFPEWSFHSRAFFAAAATATTRMLILIRLWVQRNQRANPVCNHLLLVYTGLSA